MGIRSTGIIPLQNGKLTDDSIKKDLMALEGMEDGMYKYIIFENTSKNPTLPAFKYIVAYIIPTIVSSLKKRGYNINADSLYRLFEKKFTNKITDEVMGEEVEYYNMKGLKTDELSKVAFRIKKWAEPYKITFEEREQTKEPSFTDSYADALAEQWNDLKLKFKI